MIVSIHRLRTAAAFLVTFLLVTLIRRLGRTEEQPISGGRAIVTLSSTALRLDKELPVTLYSLIQQSVPPRKIYLFLPKQEQKVFERQKDKWSKVYWNKRVEIHFTKDEGPATKFLPTLRALARQAVEHEAFLDQPVIVVDDDHFYSRDLVKTLLEAHDRHPDAAVGLRGWRIRKDLLWGVDLKQYWRHVLEAHKIDQDYRVGVLTANEGYLITPRLLIDPQALPPYSTDAAYERNAPILRLDDAPLAAHLVDDIWMAGNLAALGRPRYIVPLPPPSTPSIDITIPNAHTLEQHMTDHSISRAEANDQTIRFFADAWARENLWYAMTESQRKEEELNGRGGVLGKPPFAGSLSRIRSAIGRFTTKRRLKVIQAVLEDLL